MSDEPSPEDVAVAEQLLKAADAQEAEAIKLLYKALPDWFPYPQLLRVQQSLAVLRNAGHLPERIAEIVRAGDYQTLGSARNAIEFIQALDFLKYLTWVLSLPKADAIQQLGGDLAAQTYERSRAGQQAQILARASGLPLGHPLKDIGSAEQRNQRIRDRAAELRAEHPNLKDSDIKRRLAEWAQMSEKQIGRVLGKK